MAQPLQFGGLGVSSATQAGANGGLTQVREGNTGQVDQFRGAGPLGTVMGMARERSALIDDKGPSSGGS
jgi:hypothetical protein